MVVALGETATVDLLTAYLTRMLEEGTDIPVVAKYGRPDAAHTMNVKEVDYIDGKIVIVVE